MISRLHAFSGIRARQRPADRRQPGKSSLGRCAKNKGLISAVTLAFYWPLHSIHSLLPVAHCTLPIIPSAPKRNSPAQAPGHTVFAIPYALMGACAGEGLAGGGLEGCASPQEANPSKVFSNGGDLIGGALQGLLLVQELSCIAVDGVLDDTPGVIGAEEAADVGLFVFQLFIDRKEMHDFIKQM